MFRNRRLNEVRTHRRVGDSTAAAASSANETQTTTREVPGQAWPSYQNANNLTTSRDYHHHHYHQPETSGGRRHHTITNLGALAGLKSRLGLGDVDTKPITSANPAPGNSSSSRRDGGGYPRSNADNNKFAGTDYYTNDNNLHGTSSGHVARDLDRIYASSSSQSQGYFSTYEEKLKKQQRGGYRAQTSVGNNNDERYSRHTPYTVPFHTRSNPASAAATHRGVPPTLEADPPFVPGPANTNYFRKQSNFNTNGYNGGWNGSSGGSSSGLKGPGNGHYYGSARRGSGRVIQETDASGSPTRTPVVPAPLSAAEEPGYRPLSARSAWPAIPSAPPHLPAAAADLRAQEIDPPQQEGDAALDMLKHELNEMRVLLAQLQKRTDSNNAGSSALLPPHKGQSDTPWHSGERTTRRSQEPDADTSVTAAEIEPPRDQSSSRGVLAALTNTFRGKTSSKKSDDGSRRIEMITRAVNQQQQQKPHQQQRHGYKIFRTALRLVVYLVLLIAFGKLYVALVELTELKNTPF
jgi:hypothetical protein